MFLGFSAPGFLFCQKNIPWASKAESGHLPLFKLKESVIKYKNAFSSCLEHMITVFCLALFDLIVRKSSDV